MIENGFKKPTEEAILTDAQRAQLEDGRTKDHKVKRYLYQAIDRVVFEQILDRRTAKIVWDSMKSKFGGNERVKKSLLHSLRREFEVLEMNSSETISEYFVRVMAITNKMRSNGEDIPHSKVVEKVLKTLSARFTYVVVSIEESKDTDSISIDELQSSLVVHEQKFQRINREEEQMLNVSLEGSSGARGRGVSSPRGRGRGRGQGYDRATVECFKCHKVGHMKYECPTWNKGANYAEFDEEEELLLMAYVEEQGVKREELWFLDSCCSNHMCGDKQMFSEMDKTFRQLVKLGNNTRMTGRKGKREAQHRWRQSCHNLGVLCTRTQEKPLEYRAAAREGASNYDSVWKVQNLPSTEEAYQPNLHDSQQNVHFDCSVLEEERGLLSHICSRSCSLMAL